MHRSGRINPGRKPKINPRTPASCPLPTRSIYADCDPPVGSSRISPLISSASVASVFSSVHLGLAHAQDPKPFPILQNQLAPFVAAPDHTSCIPCDHWMISCCQLVHSKPTSDDHMLQRTEMPRSMPRDSNSAAHGTSSGLPNNHTCCFFWS